LEQKWQPQAQRRWLPLAEMALFAASPFSWNGGFLMALLLQQL